MGGGGEKIRGKARRSRPWMGCMERGNGWVPHGISRMNKVPTMVQVFLTPSSSIVLGYTAISWQRSVGSFSDGEF